MGLSLKNDTTTSQTPGLTYFNEAVKTMKGKEIEAFSSKIVHGHTKIVLLGKNMYIMTQAPEKGEEPCLPHVLSVVDTCTEMTTGSRNVTVVITNQTAVPFIIGKGVKVIQVVAANRVPPVEGMPGTLEKLDEMQGIWQTKMSIEHRKETFLQQLYLSGLEGWCGTNHTSAHALLTEDSPSHGRGSEGPHEGNVGSECYLPLPKPLV